MVTYITGHQCITCIFRQYPTYFNTKQLLLFYCKAEKSRVTRRATEEERQEIQSREKEVQARKLNVSLLNKFFKKKGTL